jgi:hypothetical protein
MTKKTIAALLSVSLVLLAGCSGKNAQSNNSANSSSPGAPAAAKPNIARAEVTTEPLWNQVSPEISLQTMVKKGIDSSNSTPDSPRYMYQLEVKLKNNGASPLVFDAAEAAFVPGKGGPLLARTIEGVEFGGRYLTRTTFSRDGDPPGQSGDDLQRVTTSRVGKGKEKQWKYETGGDTRDLLNRSETAPLVFQFTLMSGKKIVAGPFRAGLPDLNDLSSTGDTKGSQPAVVYLKFKLGGV